MPPQLLADAVDARAIDARHINMIAGTGAAALLIDNQSSAAEQDKINKTIKNNICSS